MIYCDEKIFFDTRCIRRDGVLLFLKIQLLFTMITFCFFKTHKLTQVVMLLPSFGIHPRNYANSKKFCKIPNASLRKQFHINTDLEWRTFGRPFHVISLVRDFFTCFCRRCPKLSA